ncbi:phospholipase D-like domain-containing protein [Paenibacillus chibensis]|uniref:Phospholipase D-like domain-containing protein n=1 Tax=Paenibacillus chibensis TaxID=59846 RepID=A0ABU6PRE3_9BACL|nr:phospholipase D-like domain-containing protein [Paenibacillus chibensis]
MSISIQKVPYGSELEKFVNSASVSLKITSPYITFKGIQYITKSNVVPKIITKVTASNLSSFALEGRALKHLLVLGAEIRSIPNLHAKVYLVDDNKGIITSSNLTASGFSKNVELGIYFENEINLFESTNLFFNKLWECAAPVTLDTLEALEQQIKVTKHDNGIYRVRTITDEEDIIPVPAIGKLVYNIEEKELTIRKEEVNGTELDYEEYDEGGDYFVPLPTNIKPIIDSLNSLDDRRVQTVINSLALATKENFENWLQNLKMSEFEYLIKPLNSYPYKRYVIRKIIADCSVSHLSLLINILVSDISNESQLSVYYDNLIERVKKIKEDQKEEFIGLMVDIIDSLKDSVHKGQLNGKKNFAKPNLDKLSYLLTICGKSIYKSAELEYKDVQTEVCLVPGYQEMKRKREALGDDFWYYAETFFSVLESGGWNSNLPSISSLFKELSKIKLSFEQKKRINKLARDIMASLKEVNNELVRDLIEEFNKIKMDNNLTLVQKEHLKIALLELSRTTGRLVQIYGQWTKDGQIIRDNSLKKKIDHLSTLYATFSILRKWL